MKGNKAIFKTNIIVSVLLGLVLTFGLVFGELSATVFSARAEETAQTEVETWNTDGWSEYEHEQKWLYAPRTRCQYARKGC